jgi:opacity protein-like surface antigen
MKNILPLTLALAIPAFGGTSVSVAPAPAPEPTLTQWFIGASYGQYNNVDTGIEDVLVVDNSGEVDFDLYNLQFGRTLGCFAGFNTAAYLEVGYGNGDTSIPVGNNADDVDIDLEILPVTLNFMLERNLIGGLGCYVTAGAGYAWTNTTVSFVGNDVDENDGGFYAQATAGLSYNFTEAFEVFGGVRWGYLDSVDWVEDLTLSDNDAWGWEIGARYNF